MSDRAQHAEFRPVLLMALLLGAAGCMQRVAVDAPPRSVVFFTVFSANLDDDATRVVNEVAADAIAHPDRTVIIEGYAAKLGSASTDETMSQLRAQVVADALVAKGVNRGHIALRPRGASGGDPGVESRRVDVSFGR